jgi:hypothetical protein
MPAGRVEAVKVQLQAARAAATELHRREVAVTTQCQSPELAGRCRPAVNLERQCRSPDHEAPAYADQRASGVHCAVMRWSRAAH